MENLKLEDNEDGSGAGPFGLLSKKGLSGMLVGRELGVSSLDNLRAASALAEDRLIDRDLEVLKCKLDGNSATSTTRSTFLMVFSPDKELMASTHGDHNIYVSRVKDGACLKTLRGHPRTPWCVAFHPSPEYVGILASGCLGGHVRVWDLHGGSELWRVSPAGAAGGGVIASICFHPVDRLLVIATFNEIYFWDWNDPAPFTKVSTKSEKEKVLYVKFDPLGHQLITGISNLNDADSRGHQRIVYENNENNENNDDSNDNNNRRFNSRRMRFARLGGGASSAAASSASSASQTLSDLAAAASSQLEAENNRLARDDPYPSDISHMSGRTRRFRILPSGSRVNTFTSSRTNNGPGSIPESEDPSPLRWETFSTTSGRNSLGPDSGDHSYVRQRQQQQQQQQQQRSSTNAVASSTPFNHSPESSFVEVENPPLSQGPTEMVYSNPERPTSIASNNRFRSMRERRLRELLHRRQSLVSQIDDLRSAREFLFSEVSSLNSNRTAAGAAAPAVGSEPTTSTINASSSSPPSRTFGTRPMDQWAVNRRLSLESHRLARSLSAAGTQTVPIPPSSSQGSQEQPQQQQQQPPLQRQPQQQPQELPQHERIPRADRSAFAAAAVANAEAPVAEAEIAAATSTIPEPYAQRQVSQQQPAQGDNEERNEDGEEEEEEPTPGPSQPSSNAGQSQSHLDIVLLSRDIGHMQQICLTSLRYLSISRQRRQIIRLQGIRRMLEDLQNQIRSLRAASNEEIFRHRRQVHKIPAPSSATANASSANGRGVPSTTDATTTSTNPTPGTSSTRPLADRAEINIRLRITRHGLNRAMRRLNRSSNSAASGSGSAGGIGGSSGGGLRRYPGLNLRESQSRLSRQLVSQLRATFRAMEMSPDLARSGHNNSVNELIAEESRAVMERTTASAATTSSATSSETVAAAESQTSNAKQQQSSSQPQSDNQMTSTVIQSSTMSSSSSPSGDLRALSQRLERMIRDRRLSMARVPEPGNNQEQQPDEGREMEGEPSDRQQQSQRTNSTSSQTRDNQWRHYYLLEQVDYPRRLGESSSDSDSESDGFGSGSGSGANRSRRRLVDRDISERDRSERDYEGNDDETLDFYNWLPPPGPMRRWGDPRSNREIGRASMRERLDIRAGLRRDLERVRQRLSRERDLFRRRRDRYFDETSRHGSPTGQGLHSGGSSPGSAGNGAGGLGNSGGGGSAAGLPPLTELIWRRLRRRNMQLNMLDDELGVPTRHREILAWMVDQLTIGQQQIDASGDNSPVQSPQPPASAPPPPPSVPPPPIPPPIPDREQHRDRDRDRSYGEGLPPLPEQVIRHRYAYRFRHHLDGGGGGQGLGAVGPPQQPNNHHRENILFPNTPSQMTMNHRLQAWDFSKGDIPGICDREKNIVVKEAKIHNDASVDISQDGTLLVTLCPSNLPMTMVVGLYSLCPRNRGQCYATYSLESSAVSVSLSPTSRHLLVGLTTRSVRIPISPTSLMAQVFRIKFPWDRNAERGRLIHRRDIQQTVEQGNTALNCIRWIPVPGQGIVYATNTGHLKILR